MKLLLAGFACRQSEYHIKSTQLFYLIMNVAYIRWHYGPRKSYTFQEYKLMTDFYHALSRDTPRLNQVLTSSQLRPSQSNIASGIYKFVDGKLLGVNLGVDIDVSHLDKTRDDVLKQHKQKRKLLLLLLENELSRVSVWCNPLNTVGHGYPPCFVGKAEKTITTDVSAYIYIYIIHFD